MNSDRITAWLPSRGWLMAILLFVACVYAGAELHAMELQRLEIATKDGVRVFAVEMATTEEEKTTGLMYRKKLADSRGMLFDFTPEQEVTMWMKNTYIPLDMIFIAADGRILRIAENTEPQSLRLIRSNGMTRAVLEVPAGTARKYGIEVGDHVGHKLFNGG